MKKEREMSSGLQEFLQEVDFPADKTDLLSYAVQLEVDIEVMDALDQLPEQEYRTPEEVLQAVGEVE
jgi:hypothetical protein